MPSCAANTSTPSCSPHRWAAFVIFSIISSSWNGSWWNSASRFALATDATQTAYSTVQWPHVFFCSNSAAVYCASWISRSTLRHRLDDRFGDLARIVGLLVVADVGDALVVELDPIAGHRAVVRNVAGVHAVVADRELRLGAVHDDLAGDLAEADGEQRRPDRVQQHLAGVSTIVLRRGVNRHLGAGAQQRLEERQALHVIPVQVAEQARSIEHLVGLHGLGEVAQSGAQVEQQRLLAGGVHRDARGVAPVARYVVALTRRRSSNAMERDDHPNVPPTQTPFDLLDSDKARWLVTRM